MPWLSQAGRPRGCCGAVAPSHACNRASPLRPYSSSTEDEDYAPEITALEQDQKQPKPERQPPYRSVADEPRTRAASSALSRIETTGRAEDAAPGNLCSNSLEVRAPALWSALGFARRPAVHCYP